MNTDFDQYIERRNTQCFKWDTYGADVIPMWVADMDFASPEPVIRALQERASHGVFGYPEGLTSPRTGETKLLEIIVERLARLYDWVIEPEDLCIFPGVVTGFNLACHAVAGSAGGVLVQTPIYHPILQAAEYTGAISEEASMQRRADGRYEMDWDAFEAAISPVTRLSILCNPHNPVGRVFQRSELERFAEICLKHGLVICSDEIHCDLVYSGHSHVPIASIDPGIAQNTITLMAPTKTFNLAGLQFSFAVIQNPELRKRYLDARKGLVSWVNIMGLVAAQAAYQEGQEWLDELLVYLEGNRDYLSQAIQRDLPGIQMAPPEATYLAWLDCRALEIPDNPQAFFLEKARVAFNDGAQFGPGGRGFVRLNFGCPRVILDEAVQRMKQALEAL